MCTFTSICFSLFVISHFMNSRFLGTICKPLLWGTAISFSLAYILDNSVYERIRKRRGWSMTTFILGNCILHFLPLFFPPPILHNPTWYGLYSVFIHLTWGLIKTNGTLVLDECYVPMKPGEWIICFTIATFVELTFYTSIGIHTLCKKYMHMYFNL